MKCTDKYEVREYVKSMGYNDILTKLIGVWDSPDSIDFNKLPNKFVLKCNYLKPFRRSFYLLPHQQEP